MRWSVDAAQRTLIDIFWYSLGITLDDFSTYQQQLQGTYQFVIFALSADRTRIEVYTASPVDSWYEFVVGIMAAGPGFATHRIRYGAPSGMKPLINFFAEMEICSSLIFPTLICMVVPMMWENLTDQSLLPGKVAKWYRSLKLLEAVPILSAIRLEI